MRKTMARSRWCRDCGFRNFGGRRGGDRRPWRLLAICRLANSSPLQAFRSAVEKGCFRVTEVMGFVVTQRHILTMELIRSSGDKVRCAETYDSLADNSTPQSTP